MSGTAWHGGENNCWGCRYNIGKRMSVFWAICYDVRLVLFCLHLRTHKLRPAAAHSITQERGFEGTDIVLSQSLSVYICRALHARNIALLHYSEFR